MENRPVNDKIRGGRSGMDFYRIFSQRFNSNYSITTWKKNFSSLVERLVNGKLSWLNDYDNKQKCRFWSDDDKPEAIVEASFDSQKFSVRCASWAEVIIGPY